MKRELRPKYDKGLYRIYPFIFWRLCQKCRNEFVREKGWRYIAGPFYRGYGSWFYICGSCAPTEPDAIQIASAHGMPSAGKPKPPIGPPPPPC